jgi:UrcA family protein
MCPRAAGYIACAHRRAALDAISVLLQGIGMTSRPTKRDIEPISQPLQPFVHLMGAYEHRHVGDQRTQSGAFAMSSHTGSSGRLTRIAIAAIVAIAAGIPASSFAEDSDTSAVTVKYTDLNLATTEGSRVLYQRLVDAARQVCPPLGNAAELRTNREAQRCITASVERAVKQVKSPQFAQVAASQMR